MARTANTTDKALEEFDARVRELMKHAQVDQKRTKKRARPKGRTRTKPVVVERKVQAPPEKAGNGSVTARMPLPFAIRALFMKVPMVDAKSLEEALRPFFSAVTAEQLEKLQSLLTPAQIARLSAIRKLLAGKA